EGEFGEPFQILIGALPEKHIAEVKAQSHMIFSHYGEHMIQMIRKGTEIGLAAFFRSNDAAAVQSSHASSGCELLHLPVRQVSVVSGNGSRIGMGSNNGAGSDLKHILHSLVA